MLYKFGYNSEKDWWENLDWEEVKKYHPTAPEEKPTSFYYLSSGDPMRFHPDEVQALAALGFKLEVVPYRGAMISKMQDRADRDHWDHDVSPADILEAKAVQISVPDTALMYIDEVTVEEDFCTNALQEMLDEGWRILAICPPNAARRPDYILGRRKKRDPFDD